MPVRYEFEKELNKLHKDLIKMGALIERSINDAIEALKNQDVELAMKVIERDDEVDAMELEIEHDCLIIVARQQPIATDLRDVVSILKIVTDLERIADHCEDICEYVIKLSKEKYIKPIEDIPFMAERVRKMIKDTIDAYISKNLASAQEICRRDDEIDKLFNDIVEELICIMEKNPESTRQCVDFIFIVKYLERMADHATNIAEWVAYYITGEIKKGLH